MKIPKNETKMTTYVFEGIKCYTISQNNLGKYILYKIISDDYQKMKIADSPKDLELVIEKDRRN